MENNNTVQKGVCELKSLARDFVPSSKGDEVLVADLLQGIEGGTLEMSDFSTIGLGCLLELTQPPLRMKVLRAYVERDASTGVHYNQLVYLIDKTGLPKVIKSQLEKMRLARRISTPPRPSAFRAVRRSAVA